MATPMQKPFEQCEYKYDKLARNYAKKMFRDMYGLRARDNADHYGVDLILFNGAVVTGYAEVEIKFQLDNFNYDTLHIPERKKKFIDIDDINPTMFCLFNLKGTVCYMTKGDYLKMLVPEEVRNSKIARGEFFYKVPMKLVKVISIEGGDANGLG